MIVVQSGVAPRSKDGVNRYAVNDYQSETKPSTVDKTVQIEKVREIDKRWVSNDIQDNWETEGDESERGDINVSQS